MKQLEYLLLVGLFFASSFAIANSNLNQCPNEQRLIFIDGERVSGMENIHSIFVSSLNLPEYYGRNLDALYDVLMEVNCPTQIYIMHGLTLQKKLGESSWQSFFTTICDAIDLNQYLNIEYWD